MKVFAWLFGGHCTLTLSVCILLGSVTVAVEGVSPIAQAVKMLQKMLEQARTELHAETVGFAASQQYCDTHVPKKQQAVESADVQIALLQANSEKYTEMVDRLNVEVQQHRNDVATWEGDIRAATAIRTIEFADYTKTHTDYTESINAIAAAVVHLKTQAYNRPQATALLEAVSSFNRVPLAARRQIDAFLAHESQEPELIFRTAPEASAYEFQSHDIITMLRGLEDKFRDERTGLDAEEMSRRHGYEQLVLDIRHSLSAAKSEIAAKTKSLLRYEQENTDLRIGLENIQAVRDSDVKYVADLAAWCQEMPTGHNGRQEMRAREIEALQKALQILTGEVMTGAAEKHELYMVQPRRGTVFLQFRRSLAKEPNQVRMVGYLQERSKRIGSHALLAIARRAQTDPFVKVKKMIEDLIARLLEEESNEVQHKDWCASELSTNEHTRIQKSEQAELLLSSITELQSEILVIKKDILVKEHELNQTASALVEATDLRMNISAENNATIVDAQAAQRAVAQAIAVLKEFYGTASQDPTGSSEGTEPEGTEGSAAEESGVVLIQRHHRRGRIRQVPPHVDTAPYRGMRAESSGVIAMLEVVRSDFARLGNVTQSSEQNDAAVYHEFLAVSAENSEKLTMEIQNANATEVRKSAELGEKREDLTTAHRQLMAAQEFYEKLRPSCVFTGQTYEERVQRRKEEIEALHEALRILNGDDIVALQRQ